MGTSYKYDSVKAEIIKLFCSTDRENLSRLQDYFHPDVNTSFWCATNAHIAIMIPHEQIGQAGTSELDYGSIFKYLEPLNEPLLFTLNELRQALSKFDSEPGFDYKYRQCDNCDGSGVCNSCCCKESHDCGDCNGDGQILVSKTPTGRLYYTKKDPLGKDQILKLGKGLFNPNFISLAGNAIKLLSCTDKIIQVTHNSEKTATIFLVGEIMFMIMPMIPSGGQSIVATLPHPNH